ncbi:hypothetical protein BC826DRAFT_320944 [Russula brevipes]|nr:hypothetical protein BC826DRAFT_320944 [Russula brevipes]
MSPATHSSSRSFSYATTFTTMSLPPTHSVPFALRGYAKKTGKNLMSHPLAIEIDNCETADSVIRILRGEAQAFSEYRKEDPTLINCLISVVHGFYTISSSALFDTGSRTELPPVKAIFSAIAVLLNVRIRIAFSNPSLLISRYTTRRPGQRRNTMTTLWSSSNVLKTSSHNSGFIPRLRPLLR